MVSYGLVEEVCPPNIYPGYYILDNGDSYFRISCDRNQAVRLVFPRILVLILLPMLLDYSNDCTRARSLDIAPQIKIMGEPMLVFTDLRIEICVIFLGIVVQIKIMK
jgi:hypothetical protein